MNNYIALVSSLFFSSIIFCIENSDTPVYSKVPQGTECEAITSKDFTMLKEVDRKPDDEHVRRITTYTFISENANQFNGGKYYQKISSQRKPKDKNTQRLYVSQGYTKNTCFPDEVRGKPAKKEYTEIRNLWKDLLSKAKPAN